MDCHPGHTIVFYEMMNYHEPGSQTRCSSLSQKATLIQARASFHRKGEAIKSGSRLMHKQHFIDSGSVAGMTASRSGTFGLRQLDPYH